MKKRVPRKLKKKLKRAEAVELVRYLIELFEIKTLDEWEKLKEELKK